MRKINLISVLILFGLIAANFQSLGSKPAQIAISKFKNGFSPANNYVSASNQSDKKRPEGNEAIAQTIEKSKNFGITPVQNYDESSFYGTWVTYVNEKVDGKCTIQVTWKPDNTTDVLFQYANGSTYRTTTKWKYKNFIYDEVYEDGSEGKARIDWFNKDKFALTIVQNQQTDNYQDVVRIYERKRN